VIAPTPTTAEIAQFVPALRDKIPRSSKSNPFRTLTRRSHILKRWYGTSQRIFFLESELPTALQHRLEALIARDKAQALWSNRAMIAMTAAIRNSLHIILASLRDPSHSRATPIGFIIERDPHFTYGLATPAVVREAPTVNL
jgi:hypothetical protein